MELCLSFPLIMTDRWSEFAHLGVLECGMDNVILTPDLMKKQDPSQLSGGGRGSGQSPDLYGRRWFSLFRCMIAKTITGLHLAVVQLPVIGAAEIHRKTSLSSGPWNNGAGAPLCRESHLTGAAVEQYTQVAYETKYICKIPVSERSASADVPRKARQSIFWSLNTKICRIHLAVSINRRINIHQIMNNDKD